MTVLERFARVTDRIFDRLRDRRAFTLTDEAATDGDFEELRGRPYAVLVTFRRNGEAMPSPVWFAVERGRVYVKTARDVGKVKRLRRDSRVLLAPSNVRGKPLGPAVRGTGRLLPAEEWPRAEETLAAAYGASRRISERVLGSSEEAAVYIEITPGR